MATPKYYWDTTAFLALLHNDKSPEEMAGLLEVVDMADAGEAYIITSVETVTEVLDRNGYPPARERFRKIFERPNYRMVQKSLAIGEKAADLRQKILRLKAPDATHLATALLYKVDELHTFDGDDLLKLDGEAVVEGLKIRKPSAPQKRLDLR
jgi:predicted nucleic acid-binding protein